MFTFHQHGMQVSEVARTGSRPRPTQGPPSASSTGLKLLPALDKGSRATGDCIFQKVKFTASTQGKTSDHCCDSHMQVCKWVPVVNQPKGI